MLSEELAMAMTTTTAKIGVENSQLIAHSRVKRAILQACQKALPVISPHKRVG